METNGFLVHYACGEYIVFSTDAETEQEAKELVAYYVLFCDPSELTAESTLILGDKEDFVKIVEGVYE